jgi:subtilisin family serine protease
MRRVSITLALALLAVTALLPFGLSAQQEPAGLVADRAALAAARAQLQDLEVDAAAIAAHRAMRTGPMKIVVELSDPPVVRATENAKLAGMAQADAVAAGQAQLNRIERAQDSLLQTVRSFDADAQVIYETQRVFNGVALKVSPEAALQITRLPGVARVHTLRSFELDNASSVPLIGAPEVWQAAAGVTGEGISIGIIDTGIDYLHANFGGSGSVADFDANDVTVITDTVSVANFGPSGASKVVGGFDFVGDDYNADDDATDTPAPDPDPIDCNGHGSHVAGTAAGYGVNPNFTTFTGPYTSPINFDSLYIGPGVAPEADLYALKVFGCDGSTNVVVEAIEWAVDPNGDGDTSDRLDVINMSLGVPFGVGVTPEAIASDNAAMAGVIVVTSAGNQGDTHYISGSPGSADYAIATAGSVDAASVADGIRVQIGAGPVNVEAASFSVLYDWANSAPVTGTLIYFPSDGTANGPNTGCSAYDAGEAAQIAGKVLLIDWTEPSCGGSVARSANATAAGAIGVIMADTEGPFDLLISGSPTVPAVSVPFEVGADLKAALAGNTVTIGFDYALRNSVRMTDPAQIDTVYTSTSRGPRGGDSALKPDIAAPGVTVFSAAVGTGGEGASFNGTSMAAPHIAGTMALLRELHPDLTVPQIKALAMNTATNDVFGLPDAGHPLQTVQRIGTGRVNVPQATETSAIIYNTERPELVSLSFGAVEITEATTISKTLTVSNFGDAAASYSVNFTPSTQIPGVSYVVTPATVNVAAGGTATVVVEMRADPALMRHIPDPLLQLSQLQLPRHFLNEASGVVKLFSTAPTSFSASLSGHYEVPPTGSAITGSASFTLDAGTGEVDYEIVFDDPITLREGVGSHLHRGAAGANGPVAVALLPAGAYAAGTYTGTVTLSASDVTLLQSGGLYANFHTDAFPGGEIRGQVVPEGVEALRVGVYATARPASEMRSSVESLRVGDALSTTVTLTGTGLLTGDNLPTDYVSVGTAFELQLTSGVDAPAAYANADLSHVGVMVDQADPTNPYLYFGLATHGDHSTASPYDAEFDIYIDTNGDGEDDFLLFNWEYVDLASTGFGDEFVSVLVNLETGSAQVADFINVIPAAPIGDLIGGDTAPFNNNVLVVSVALADLGLGIGNSDFDYQIATYSTVDSLPVELSDRASYDVATPGIDLADTPNTIFGVAFLDQPNTGLTFNFDASGFDAADSKGIMLLHHHNTRGNRVEVITVNPKLFIPLAAR